MEALVVDRFLGCSAVTAGGLLWGDTAQRNNGQPKEMHVSDFNLSEDIVEKIF